MPLTLPPNAVVDAIHGSVTRVTSRVEFYENDGVTRWEPEGAGVDAPLVSGKVTIDHSREERRTASLEIYNEGGLYKPSPDGLWYDKVVKVYRGVQYSGGSWEALMGTFLIDTIRKAHFPNTLSLTMRDKAKMLKTIFPTVTSFPDNYPIEDLVRDVAVSGGIDIADINVPITGEALDGDKFFDAGAERWSSMAEVATSYGYELFFEPDGSLTMRQFQDPYALPAEYTFRADSESNLASFDKETTDARLKNHVVVIGQNAEQLPIFGEAENTDASSPTRIAKIGRRTERIDSSYVSTVAQAEALALKLLKVMALEQFDLSMDAIAVPYIDVGVVVGFQDPDPSPGDPTEYLLQTVDIPLGPGPMSAKAGRVINITGA